VAVVAMLLGGTGEVRAQAGGLSVAFVDLDSVFTNYHKTRLAEAQLKEQADALQTERKELIQQFETLQADAQRLRAQAQNTALNEDARNARRAEAEEKLIEVRDMEAKIRRLEETAQRKIDDQSRRARRRLVEEINELVAVFAAEKGYDLILDRSGQTLNGVPVVVYFNPSMDITEALIAHVNAR
jgi:outer membrane protein